MEEANLFDTVMHAYNIGDFDTVKKLFDMADEGTKIQLMDEFKAMAHTQQWRDESWDAQPALDRAKENLETVQKIEGIVRSIALEVYEKFKSGEIADVESVIEILSGHSSDWDGKVEEAQGEVESAYKNWETQLDRYGDIGKTMGLN